MRAVQSRKVAPSLCVVSWAALGRVRHLDALPDLPKISAQWPRTQVFRTAAETQEDR